MSVRVLQGDCFDVLPTLPPGSVDCVVTSVPYWRLRSYLPAGHLLKSRELGHEATPQGYVARIVEAFRLVRDAMAAHACAFINVGDTYTSGGRGGGGRDSPGSKGVPSPRSALDGSLCLIPQRLAIALADDGWHVRSVIVWHKPAPMPESVFGWAWRRCRVKVASSSRDDGRFKLGATGLGHRSVACFKDERTEAGLLSSVGGRPTYADCPGCDNCRPHGGYVLRRGRWRPTRSYEVVLMLAKSARYYADGEAMRQPTSPGTLARFGVGEVRPVSPKNVAADRDQARQSFGTPAVVDGANLRDVWTIPAEPLREQHYAAYPTALVELCLRAGTSARGYCPQCSAPWCRVLETVPVGSWHGHDDDAYRGNRQEASRRGDRGHVVGWKPPQTTGWRPSCACPPHDPRPGLVLDPFAGSGRTGIACLRLGLDFIGIDLHPDYVAMSRRLLREESPLFSGVEL